jgi:hypothetical protein
MFCWVACDRGARLAELRLTATSISTGAQLPDGRAREIIIGPTGIINVSTPSTSARAIPVSRIRPAVVAKLVAEMNRRFHVPAARIDYLVLSSPPGAPIQWVLYTKAPTSHGFTASLNGGHLARLPGT